MKDRDTLFKSVFTIFTGSLILTAAVIGYSVTGIIGCILLGLLTYFFFSFLIVICILNTLTLQEIRKIFFLWLPILWIKRLHL